MGDVRTRYLAALVVILSLLGNSGCLDGDAGELVFVEQEPGVSTTERPQQAPLTSSSEVELTEPNVDQIRLCVLPFRNLTNLEDIDTLRDLFNQSIQYNLEDYVRVIQSIIYDEDQYSTLVDSMGRQDLEQPDQEMARMIRESTGAELILFGNITEVDNQVQIEPYIISFEDGFVIRPMDARPVPTNFLAFMDSYVQDLLDEIIQRRQG